MRAMASLLLQNNSREIEDSIKPGGTGDAYANLNNIQEDILREVIQLGLSIGTLKDFYYTVNGTPLAQLRAAFSSLDQSYVEDFWTKEGNLGSEESTLGEIFRSVPIEFDATVVDVKRDEKGVTTAVSLSKMPSSKAFDFDWDTTGYRFTVFSTNGTTLRTVSGRFNYTTSIATLIVPENELNGIALYTHIQPHTTLHISNREMIASMVGTDTKYPTSPIIVATSASTNSVPPTARQFTSNALSTHLKFLRKVPLVARTILASSMVRQLSFKTCWIMTRCHGGHTGIGCRFRRALARGLKTHTHGYGQPKNQGLLVDYTGIYQQALRDLSAWVEQGVTPVSTTN